ncbi:Eukaryotic initiation factor 4A-10 [Olea europaea subsp. europaea]|uniref:RNA helicase n=1 Tax=Olea europaea subsp. europaea TaxID=158383 RepID=A0A8S0RMS8_OLEEU|nr:Eukaryotic initiation factor 4A-10 [Olea europaea subsp. europaea]
MAGIAPEGSQFDVRQFDTKMNELVGSDGREELFLGYDEAQSGTGKTAASCFGILHQLDYGTVECQALVLAQTRELTQQIEKVMRALGDYLGVKVHACMEGTSVREDQRILSSELLRPKIQVGVFSATMPPEALEITRNFMNKPVRILMKRSSKPSLIFMRPWPSVIFVNTRHKVHWLSDKMQSSDHTVSATHGDMDQNTRDIIMLDFRSGSSRVLIAADLLACGIDVQEVSLVISYDLPTQPENYLDCIGHSG